MGKRRSSNSSISNANDADNTATTGKTRGASRYFAFPVEKIRSVSRRKLLLFALGVFAILGVVNLLIVIYLDVDVLDKGQVIVKEKWERLYDLDAPVDYLVLGDSAGNQGFDPAIVEEELGVWGVNLATIGNFGFVDDVWMMESYIELYGVPELVISIHAYDVPRRKLEIDDLLATYPVPFPVIQRVVTTVTLPEVFELLWIYQNRLFPLYYRRDSLSRIADRFLEEGFQIFEPNALFNEYGLMTLREYDEFVVEDDMFVFRRELRAGHLYGGFSEVNRDAFNQMVALADTYDFDVYFVNSPIYNDLYKHSVGFKHIREELDSQYMELVAQSQNVHYVADAFPFPASDMENLDHVLDTGIHDYTIQIMNLVWNDSG